MDKPYILQSQVIFYYQRNSNIRKKVFEFESALKNYFATPFNLIPIADELHPELPRFEAISINNHSQLQVSQHHLSFATSYDESYKYDIHLSRKYINERVGIFKELLKDEKILYLAYIVNLNFIKDKHLINDYIKEKSGIKSINEETIDLNFLYSFPIMDKYYLNVKTSKYVNQNININFSENSQESNFEYGISIEIDVNSRFLSNNNISFDELIYNDIEKSVFEVIDKNDLETFLSGDIKL